MTMDTGEPGRWLSTSALARATGVEASTIRFYERRRLLVPQGLRPSGYRQYGPEAVARVHLIRRLQALGFGLQEIAQLLTLEAPADGESDDSRRKLQETLTSITERMELLGVLRTAVEALLNYGPRPGTSQRLVELLDRAGPNDPS